MYFHFQPAKQPVSAIKPREYIIKIRNLCNLLSIASIINQFAQWRIEITIPHGIGMTNKSVSFQENLEKQPAQGTNATVNV